MTRPLDKRFNTSLRHTLWLVATLLVMFLLTWLLPTPPAFRGIANYLPLHMTLEVFSIVVAMLIFGVAWNAYSSEHAGNILILACAMLAVGLIDFVHMLSFKDMPQFITPSGPEKAINFWLAARFITALVLLVVAVRPWTPLHHSQRWKFGLLSGGIVITALVSWIGVFHQEALPRTFIEGQGLTPFKIEAEFLIVGLLTVPAIVFYRQARRGAPHDAAGLFAAVVISILSELSFMLYKDVTDIFNLLGHIYKVIAYFFIYHSVFVASVREPYQRLYVAEKELRRYKAHLEELVQQRTAALSRRTADLESANADLASFSYSVSHDLRAPLRAIDGFAAILREDYASQLDDEGKRLFQIVSDNAKKMGQLIDDILAFSRASRLEPQATIIDMNILAQEAWQGLEPQRAGRTIEFHLRDLPMVCGDLAAMRQVLQNLLSNAVKFTRGREPAVIELGCRAASTENAYYVEDNGAGFDMAYVGKLFGLFQRLHSLDEFEGTGVGLAIVKRFIAKHGGRVWAEGRPGEGATFWFALPPAGPCNKDNAIENGSKQPAGYSAGGVTSPMPSLPHE